MVLSGLVFGCPRALFRSEPAALVNVARPEHDHRHRFVFERDGGRDESAAGSLDNLPIVPDAVLRLEFFGIGERKRI